MRDVLTVDGEGEGPTTLHVALLEDGLSQLGVLGDKVRLESALFVNADRIDLLLPLLPLPRLLIELEELAILEAGAALWAQHRLLDGRTRAA